MAEDSPVRVIDVFFDELDLSGLGFKVAPAKIKRRTQQLNRSITRYLG